MNGRAELEVLCPQCGPVRARANDARCGVDAGGEALCEVECPACSAPILVRTTTKVAETIFWLGGAEDPRAPLELLEVHAGPPIGWDDVLDLHVALSQGTGAGHLFSM
jgi:DNA-directed RNA polymerase subunit RPC12/RpoP